MRSVLFCLIVLSAAIGARVYQLRTEGIFACQAGNYSTDRYLSACDALGYGDYEHGAFWYPLEPAAARFAADAQVLFVGSSRTQLGFSSNATDRWFAANGISYYLLGFAYYENYVFERALLRRLAPKAAFYVINIDAFFEDTESVYAHQIFHDPGVEERYRAKALWQLVHRPFCSLLPRACGQAYVIFRSRRTGEWFVQGGQFRTKPMSVDMSVDSRLVERYVERARQFLAQLPVGKDCIALTIVPRNRSPLASARAIAAALDMNLVTPQVTGLETFDGSHLTRASAERWSAAFLRAVGPDIRKCVISSRTLTAGRSPQTPSLTR